MKKILICFSLMVMVALGVAMPVGAEGGGHYVEGTTTGNSNGWSSQGGGGGGGSCGGSSPLFGLRPWYEGITESQNGKCEIKFPDGDAENMAQFVWAIVLNVLYDVSVLVGYIAIIMIAWGGYLYMFSRGMPDRAERGKKTLIAAIAGLAISMLASVIMNTIVSILTQQS